MKIDERLAILETKLAMLQKLLWFSIALNLAQYGIPLII